MNFYRSIHIQGDEEGEEWELFAVVPEHVTAQQVMFAPEETDIICECFTQENADLIVDLLNSRRMH